MHSRMHLPEGRRFPMLSLLHGRFAGFAILSVLFALAPLLFAAMPQPPRTPEQPVVDMAGVVTDEVKSRVNAMLRTLEQKTGAEVVILTVTSLDGEGIESFSLRMAEQWRLGKKGKDNGMLLVVALTEKKYRFETGYGLEGLFPDSFLGSLGREQLVPNFKQGDYSAGIQSTAAIIAKRIADDRGVDLGELPAVSRPQPVQKNNDDVDWVTIAIIIFVILSASGFFGFGTRPGGRSRSGPYSGGWYGGGSGGGGWGSHSDGGFGGGGGSFGGGGASGGWGDSGS
ncbi:MAG TPA: TPM domain-containing protein [Dissulfurispiraceae bacterium]|nr:TPM domain-containing protein [Dissulfurispiraceae bacterium]